MTKKKFVIDGKTIIAADWQLKLQNAAILYIVLKALKNDKEAREVLDDIAVTLFDENSVQVWPVPENNPSLLKGDK